MVQDPKKVKSSLKPFPVENHSPALNPSSYADSNAFYFAQATPVQAYASHVGSLTQRKQKASVVDNVALALVQALALGFGLGFAPSLSLGFGPKSWPRLRTGSWPKPSQDPPKPLKKGQKQGTDSLRKSFKIKAKNYFAWGTPHEPRNRGIKPPQGLNP